MNDRVPARITVQSTSRANAALEAAARAEKSDDGLASLVRSITAESEHSATPLEERMVGWLLKCCQLRGRAPVVLAVHLLQRAGEIGRFRHLSVDSTAVQTMRLGRTTLHTALRQMQTEGLITALRRQGQPALITLTGLENASEQTATQRTGDLSAEAIDDA